MKSLREQILKMAVLPEIKIHDPTAEDIYEGEEQENTRLYPLLLALADVAEAADVFSKSGMDSDQDTLDVRLRELEDALK